MTEEDRVLAPETAEAPHDIPPGRILIDRATLLEKLAISDATLRRKMDQGVLPRPIEIGGAYCLRWYLDEIDGALVRFGQQRHNADRRSSNLDSSVDPVERPPTDIQTFVKD
jgi:predicted DNA-binding transcriptional regulator AlpA